MQRSIPVTPISGKSRIFLCALAAVAAGFFIYLFVDSTSGLSAEKSRAQLPGLLIMLVLVGAAFALMWWAVDRRSLILTDSELIVRAGFYGRRLPRASLLVDQAAEFSLLDRREYAPRLRTNGIGLPGFRAGWFRLRTNEKALVLLTDPFGVTYLPTRDGYALLISTTELLGALGATGAAGSAATKSA